MGKKDSAFNLSTQNKGIESKIVVALERISQAFRVLLWEDGKEAGLSPIQIQLLIFIRHHNEEKSKVSYLAKEFNLTKPTISDAVKSLEQKGLITKKPEPNDTRSYSIHLTSKGKSFAASSSHFSHKIQQPIDKLSNEDKENMLFNLLEIIRHLNNSGVISIQRMCYTCRFHTMQGQSHYCNLLQSKLNPKDIRVDCAEHEFGEAVC